VSVRELPEGKSTWVAKGPKDAEVTWDAEIIEDVANEVISWRSLPGSVVRNEGAVYFESLPGDRTELRLYLEFHPPLGAVGLRAAQLLGDDPVTEIREDLDRFKQILDGVGVASLS
jgi:uncharacterized membrane protein